MSRARGSVGALVLTSVLLVSGCGGGSSGTASSTTTRPSGSKLTGSDAERIAQVLFRNVSDGGATVSVAFDYQPMLSVTMAGRIDFAAHTGRLTVTTRGPSGTPDVADLAFTEDTVYEQPTPDQRAALDRAGRGEVAWLARPPTPGERPVDRVIDLLVKLAATRPDNPRLVAQGDTTFDRTETVTGRPADVFTTAKGTSYWIDRRTDRLVRFSARLDGFDGAVQVDLSAHGRRPAVKLPSPASVLPLSELPPVA